MIPIPGPDTEIGISTLLCCFWLISSSSILIFHVLLNVRFIQVPQFLKELYFFGKLKGSFVKDGDQTFLSVPKRWFIHFYYVGFILHSTVLVFAFLHMSKYPFNLYEWMQQLPSVVQSALEIRTDQKWLSPCVILLMEWFQIVRRLYECLFISSFSKSTMSPVHYIYGVFLYASFGIGLLFTVDLQQFSQDTIQFKEVICCLCGFFLFAAASLSQYKSMVIFASLRSSRKDNPKLSHHLPKGHLFEWVSSPHYLSEIVIYLSYSLVFGMANPYLNSVLVFVFVNQICSGWMVHQWYKKTFAHYPSERKAIIPYIL